MARKSLIAREVKRTKMVAKYAELRKRLKEEGFDILNETPKQGADNKLVVFLHPKSTNGVLVELCQERSEKD